MKLRFQTHSIRLRLKKGEVEQLASMHRVEEKIALGNAISDTFHYVLEATPAVVKPIATLTNRGLVVQVPLETALRWASGPEVGIEATLPPAHGSAPGLQLLIEKDFICLHGGTEEDNADTYPHPLAAAGATPAP